MTARALKSGEDPQLQLGPLRIWIHHRQFADSSDYWDGNWLVATAQVEANGANVTAFGSFLHLGELKTWLTEIENLQTTLAGSAELPTMEPNLRVMLTANALGKITGEIEITPDHLEQEHRFTVELDQSYLPELSWSIRRVLKTYPIVGQQP